MAKYTRETTLGEILKDEAAVKVIDQHMPGVTKNPAIKMVGRFKLEKLVHVPQAGLDSDTLDKLLEEINSQVE